MDSSKNNEHRTTNNTELYNREKKNRDAQGYEIKKIRGCWRLNTKPALQRFH
jgi:chromosome segregation and condensation protein ScpB